MLQASPRLQQAIKRRTIKKQTLEVLNTLIENPTPAEMKRAVVTLRQLTAQVQKRDSPSTT